MKKMTTAVRRELRERAEDGGAFTSAEVSALFDIIDAVEEDRDYERERADHSDRNLLSLDERYHEVASALAFPTDDLIVDVALALENLEDCDHTGNPATTCNACVTRDIVDAIARYVKVKV